MVFTSKDFEDNWRRLIDNPLKDLRPNELNERADAFAGLVNATPPDAKVVSIFSKFVYWAHLSNGQPSAPGSFESEASEPDEELISLFRKAAEVAQKPQKLDSLSLSEREKHLLRTERDVKFWDQPKALRVTVVTLCLSAIIQGWIQSGSNGANQNWPVSFHIIDDNRRWNSPQDQWIFGGVNAITFLAASIFGCWLSDPLQSMVLGRRGAIFASGLICFASLIGSACTRNWQQLLVCRALVGLGMGAKASVTPIFGAEVSPSHLRGALVMNWQLFDAFGIFLGFTANLILLNAGRSLSWRLQYASACVPTACLLTLIWTIPESPRWLLKQRRHKEAFAALCSLRQSRLQAAIELFYANAQLQIESALGPQRRVDVEKSAAQTAQHVEHLGADAQLNRFQESYDRTNYFSRIAQLFWDHRTRRATLAATVIMISQQLCGINVLAFYSSTFFQNENGPNPAVRGDGDAVRALWLSWGVGLANFLFTFPAYYLIDKKGRRFLLFCTYPGMILTMLGACLSFLSSGDVTVRVGVFMFLFIFFYSWGQGPVAFAYSSEVFPLINREAGMSFSVFINLLGAGLLTLFVPLAQTTTSTALGNTYQLSQARLLGFFVGSNVLALILIFLFVPETAGAAIRKKEGHLNYMRLEELNYIFSVSTIKHVKFQTQKMLPYACKTVLWWTFSWFTSRLNQPTHPGKMWVWAEMTSDEVEKEHTQVRITDRGTTDIEPGVHQRSGARQLY